MSRPEWSPDWVRFDDSSNGYRTILDADSPVDPSTAVSMLVDDVADREGRTLDWKLYESVDPDALDTLFSPAPSASRRAGTVTFPAGPFRVSVGGDGTITVRTDEG